MIDVVCDLDGVLYRGQTPIDGASEALTRLIAHDARVTYVTNNSTRSPAAAARNIEAITGVPARAGQVVTSSQAAASMLTPEDWPALAVGEEGVTDALQDRGVPLTSVPGEARAVVVGMDQALTYEVVADASEAVRGGARFVATNSDPTYPTQDRLLPGAGALVAAIATASGREPEVAGKPHAPLRELLKSRGIASAWVIGDRIDTDIALAVAEPGWISILVLTGVTGPDDDHETADHVVADFSAAVDLVLGARTPR